MLHLLPAACAALYGDDAVGHFDPTTIFAGLKHHHLDAASSYSPRTWAQHTKVGSPHGDGYDDVFFCRQTQTLGLEMYESTALVNQLVLGIDEEPVRTFGEDEEVRCS
eukprot:6149484-Prymnesium_polylepis.1